MSLPRRKTLALIGGGLIVAAGGTACLAVTREPKSARAPWSLAGGYDDARMNALSHAILAPNPHNRQPWKIDLRTPGEVTLFVDTDRLLPHTDPFSRQIVIGLGCFLELMRMAALETGHVVETELFPEGSDAEALDARPVARCVFHRGAAMPDPLFAAAPLRRTTKVPFDTGRPVAADTLAQILSAAEATRSGGSVAADDIGYWRTLTREALRIEIETPRTYRESVELFRIGHREIDANPDGIAFSGPLFEAMALAGLFTRESALDTGSATYKEGIKAVYANTDTAMGHLWLVTGGNSRDDQIAVGRDWLRVNLAATAIGVGIQPLSQTLQEYPEMAALYSQTHQKLAPGGGTVQMFARIGYGKAVPQTPRWPVTHKIMDG